LGPLGRNKIKTNIKFIFNVSYTEKWMSFPIHSAHGSIALIPGLDNLINLFLQTESSLSRVQTIFSKGWGLTLIQATNLKTLIINNHIDGFLFFLI